MSLGENLTIKHIQIGGTQQKIKYDLDRVALGL